MKKRYKHNLNLQNSLLFVYNNVFYYFNKTKIGFVLYKNLFFSNYLYNISNTNNNFVKSRFLNTLFTSLNFAIISGNLGYYIELVLVGLGYKITRNKKTRMLFFELHFSHKLFYQIPRDVLIKTAKKKLLIYGLNKQRVADVAIEIRNLRAPNIYKGKGVQYFGEVLKLKTGKQR